MELYMCQQEASNRQVCWLVVVGPWMRSTKKWHREDAGYMKSIATDTIRHLTKEV